MQYPNAPANDVTLIRQGNLAYLVMGMGTEGGRSPYQITVAANALPGAVRDSATGNWWQGDPISRSGYSLGVMQYDFGNFGNTQNTADFAQQVENWAISQGRTLSVTASQFASQLMLRGGTSGAGLEAQANWISVADRDLANGYLATQAGQTWVYNNLEVGRFRYNSAGAIIGGTGAVTQAVALIQNAVNTPYFTNLSAADQQTVELLLLKEVNQGGNVATATAWLIQQGNTVGSAQAYFNARMALPISGTLSQGLTAAYNTAGAIAAVQNSALFGPIWNNAQNKSLDSGAVAQDPELLALRALFVSGASVGTINALGNRVPGTFSGDGKTGFVAVDSAGNVVVVQSAVSNGVAGSNQNAPASAAGWQLGQR